MRALAPEVCSLPPEMLTPSSSSRVGLLVPLSATEPLLTNRPPSVSVGAVADHDGAGIDADAGAKCRREGAGGDFQRRALRRGDASHRRVVRGVLLTTPPLRIVACVVETGTPLVQLLAVDQSPVLPAFQLSNELMPMPTSSGKPAETSTTLPAEIEDRRAVLVERGHLQVGRLIVGAHRVVEYQQAGRQIRGTIVVEGGGAVVERQRRQSESFSGIEQHRFAHAHGKLHALSGVGEHRLRRGDRGDLERRIRSRARAAHSALRRSPRQRCGCR